MPCPAPFFPLSSDLCFYYTFADHIDHSLCSALFMSIPYSSVKRKRFLKSHSFVLLETVIISGYNKSDACQTCYFRHYLRALIFIKF